MSGVVAVQILVEGVELNRNVQHQCHLSALRLAALLAGLALLAACDDGRRHGGGGGGGGSASDAALTDTGPLAWTGCCWPIRVCNVRTGSGGQGCWTAYRWTECASARDYGQCVQPETLRDPTHPSKGCFAGDLPATLELAPPEENEYYGFEPWPGACADDQADAALPHD